MTQIFKVELGLDMQYLLDGIRHMVVWDMETCPHLLITGGTGSGKTYASMLLLGKVGRRAVNTELFVCDFKGDPTFSFLEGCERFFRYEEVLAGLELFYIRFKARQGRTDRSQHPLVLFIDEWPSLLNWLEKKDKEHVLRLISTLLMLGRSFNVHVIVTAQRPDAEYFSKARDNFGVVVAMGNISKEAKAMLFSDVKEDMTEVNQRGQGYVLIDGKGLFRMVVPLIQQPEKLQRCIKAICHPRMND